MRWIDIMRISVRMLRTNGLRSLLTILGIGVAISLIVLLIGLGYGLQTITIGSIVESKTLLSLDIIPAPNNALPLSLEDVAMIKQTPGIREATPVLVTSGEIRLNDKLASIAVTAANPSFLEMEGVKIKEGYGSTYTEEGAELVISPQILELIDLPEDGIVGSTARLSYTDPNNQNLSKTIETVTIAGISDGSTATVYTPYSLLASGTETRMTMIKAVAEDRDALVAARDTLVRQGYLVETLLETLDQARAVFRWVTIGLAAFGTIALVVAAIGMFNTLTISLLERTREIGIMKAIGVTNRAVKRLFLAEAALIGFFGGLSGIGIGLLADSLLSLAINQIALRYGGFQLNIFQYPRGFLLSMVLYPVILAIITGLYPSVRASKLNPLRALRYE